MAENDPKAIYWDTSAILSVIFEDAHSAMASQWIKSPAVHFISCLAYSESQAVIARMGREQDISASMIQSGMDSLETGPWRRLRLQPEWTIIKELALKWSLRGADLWHLALVKSLKKEIPELMLLTFDQKLKIVSSGERFDIES